jgi:hypothetical protein
MTFEVQEKGYIAKILTGSDFIALGTPVAVITKKSDDVAQFANYVFGSAAQTSESQPKETVSAPPTPVSSAPAQSFPQHSLLQYFLSNLECQQ